MNNQAGIVQIEQVEAVRFDKIMTAVTSWLHDADSRDDMTLLLVRRT